MAYDRQRRSGIVRSTTVRRSIVAQRYSAALGREILDLGKPHARNDWMGKWIGAVTGDGPHRGPRIRRLTSAMNVSGRKWIMIVEDDPRVRELAEFAAKKSGAFSTVTLASNGAEAVRRLWAPPRRGEPGEFPDAVLTDLSMPSMDGLQLARALQAHPATRHVPLFMFSSSGRPNDRESALSVGCRQFFEKPLRVDSLVDIMQAIAEDLIAFARS